MKESCASGQSQTMPHKIHPGLLENNRFILFLLGIVILFVFTARMHLLSFPLERDEGEYAYMGSLILDGHPPYTLACNMKLPGTYYMYALIMKLFGESTEGIHMGLALINILSIALLFFISRGFVSNLSAVISAASFGILSTSWTLMGQAAHATHFVTFFALLGIYSILKTGQNEKLKTALYFISGLFFSLAFICKQSGLFFLFFGLSVLLINECRNKPLLKVTKLTSVFILSFLLPVFIMLLYIYIFSDFNKFWFWTVSYLMKYGTQNSFSQALENFKKALDTLSGHYSFSGYLPLWGAALMGMLCIFIHNTSRANKVLIVLFFLFSFLTAIPGFFFRPHYFLPLLPALSLLISIFFDNLKILPGFKFSSSLMIPVPFLLFLIVLSPGIYPNIDYLFRQNPDLSCKRIYFNSPFPECIEIAEFLKKNTLEGDKIAVLGSEPEIYFYAGRYSATGYLYTYSLLEPHPYALSMQKEMIREIEKEKPKYIVLITPNESLGIRANSETFFLKWINLYLNENYSPVGYCELIPKKISSLKLNPQFNFSKPEQQKIIYILKKNEVSPANSKQ